MQSLVALLKILALSSAIGTGGVVQAGNGVPAKVSRVVDGDTIWVKPSDTSGVPAGTSIKNGRVKVRVAGIDAPESCQPYGKESTKALRQMLPEGSTIILVSYGVDKYGRWLANPIVNNIDVSQQMVLHGYAWNYTSGRDKGQYASQQSMAQNNRVGLWGHPDPIQPGQWRKVHGPCN